MTVDTELTVRAIEASSDTTPWPLCKEAESTLGSLVGEKLARGWSSKVKERLRGAASCTHLMEMFVPMATTALQGIRGLQAKVLGSWKVLGSGLVFIRQTRDLTPSMGGVVSVGNDWRYAEYAEGGFLQRVGPPPQPKAEATQAVAEAAAEAASGAGR